MIQWAWPEHYRRPYFWLESLKKSKTRIGLIQLVKQSSKLSEHIFLKFPFLKFLKMRLCEFQVSFEERCFPALLFGWRTDGGTRVFDPCWPRRIRPRRWLWRGNWTSGRRSYWLRLFSQEIHPRATGLMKVFLGLLALLGLAHADEKKGPLVTDKVRLSRFWASFAFVNNPFRNRLFR